MYSVDIKTFSEKERHHYLLKTYILNQHNNKQKRCKRDIDVIREHHRFLWNDVDDKEPDSWELRLVRRYYNKLFKEYCLADLSRYKENKIALRWRTEAEVVDGKGQFQCGCFKCDESDYLRSWEVNFAYIENSQRKNALVKLRLCPLHSTQLNYNSKKRELKRLKNQGSEALKAKHKKIKKTKTKDAKRTVDDRCQNQCVDSTTIKIGDSTIESNTALNDEANDMEYDVWKQKLDIETEPLQRESKFERYLQDLLL